MLSNALQFVRANGRWKGLVAGSAVLAVIAFAGGWALADASHGHGTAGASLTAGLRSGSAGGGTSGAKPPSGVSQTSRTSGPTSQSGASQPSGGSASLADVPGLVRLASAGAGAQILSGDPSGGAARSATGGGFISFFSFGFTDQSHLNGAVAGTFTGNAEFRFKPPSPGSIHIDVNCLQIVGDRAFISGISTNTAFGIAAGTEFLFGVQDDDTAPKPDMISDLFFSPGPHPFTCQTFHAPPHYTVQGNIEIH